MTAGQTGDTVDLTFQVIGSGSTFLDIAQSAGGNPTAINGGNVTLVPAPTNATNDPNVDGVLNVVIQPNQPPFNRLPAASLIGPVLFNPAAVTGLQTAAANTVAFTGATAVSVSDADAGTGSLTTRLTLTGSGSTGPVGTLNVTASGAAAVTGNGTATVTVGGSLTDLNATLASLVYTPGAGFFGTATLTASTSDNGNSGFG